MKTIVLILLCLVQSFCAEANLKIVDGDSLELNGDRIRMQGIDAPEYRQSCRDKDGKEYRCGIEALNYLQNLVGKQKVDCCCEEKPDRYKRKLCECYAGNTNLNREMVRNGWAVAYRYEKFKKDEKYAKKHGLGIWQGKFMRPAFWRTLQREQEKARKKRLKENNSCKNGGDCL